LVDRCGNLLVVQVTGAGAQDHDQALDLIRARKRAHERLVKMWANEGCQSNAVDHQICAELGVDVELVHKPSGKDFQVAHKCRVVEHTSALLVRYRRLSNEHEYCPQTNENWIYLDIARHLLRQLAVLLG
jgi:hypothetical protein